MTLFDQAELALAAYANLSAGVTTDNIQRLQPAGFVATQANEFAKRYPRIISQFNDAATSFSATVFSDVSGNLSLAIRGTLEVGDFVPTDATIASEGAGYDQIIAMANWWRRVSSTPGVLVAQHRVAVYGIGQSIPPGGLFLFSGLGALYYLESAGEATATGELVTALGLDADHRVRVAGHSLGGHLAMAFGALFPESTSQVAVFNAPGFKDTTTNREFFGRLGGSIPNDSNSYNVTNVIADESSLGDQPWNGVAGLHSRPGASVSIAIENQWLSDEPDAPSARNHSQMILADSLAVYELLNRLSPNLETTEYGKILGQSARGTSASYERVVDALEVALGVDVTPLPTGNNNREALFRSIYGLGADPQYVDLLGTLSLRSSGGVEKETLANLAKVDFGYFVSVHYLLPLVIEGAAPQVAEAHDDLFAVWSADAQKRSTGRSDLGFTDRYIERRAAFLLAKNAADHADQTSVVIADQPDTWRHIDLGQEYTVTAFGDALASTVRVASFGGDAPEVLLGDSWGDYLFGGEGVDLLRGGGGDDYLEGGHGKDVYIYAASKSLLGGLANDGADDVLDADGRGVIRYKYTEVKLLSPDTVQSHVVGGLGIKLSETLWQSPDGKFTFAQQFSGLRASIIGDAGGSVFIHGFDFEAAQGKGFLGIRLVEDLGEPETPVRTFYGDKQDWDSNPSTPNVIDPMDDGLGNSIRADGQDGRPDIPFANRADVFLGSSADAVERFETAGGDDLVRADGIDSVSSAAGGRDIVLAGAGSDIVEAGGNDDWVEGGAGDDILGGNSGNDVIWADSSTINNVRITLAQAITAGRTAAAIAGRGDLLSGDAGFDRLIGSSAADLLLGGADVDIIVGGGGDDNIYGDASLVSASRGWFATRRVSASGATIIYELIANGYVLSDTDPGSPGSADYIYGGAGADWIFAGAGDDYVEAGDTLGDPNAPDDVVFGEAGDDTIIGGTGSDVLHGDSAAVDAAGLSGNDYLDGGAGVDLLFGGGGDDILFGGDGGDQLHGNDGNDILTGERGNDLLIGGPGKDTYVFFRGDGVDTIQDVEVGNAADASVLVVGPGISRSNVRFRPGSLTVDFGEGDEVHFEGFDPDNPTAVRILDVIRFWNGDFMTFEDILAQGFDIDGGDGDDVIFGTAVTDRIFAGDGNDFVMAKAGDDTVDGGTGDDEIYAGEGNDTVTAGEGNDFVDGGGGDDTIDGGAGDDVLHGGDGADTISGGEGQDLLFGGAGNDVLNGDGGDDVLDGGTGNDMLAGGAGRDSYVLYGGMGTDVITDGEGGETNVLQLGAGLGIENLKASQAGDSLVLTLRGLSDSVTVTDYYARPQDWVVRDFAGTETALSAVINQPDPYAGDFLGRLWADTKLGASAATFGRAYAIGWTPLSASTFQSTQERAFLEYRKQTTVETFSRFEAPHDQLAQNTFVDLHHEVEGFGTRPSTNFQWMQHSFVSGYTQSDDTFIQGSWIALPQFQSPGQGLLTLKPDRSLTLNYQLTQWGSFGSVVSYDTGTESILAIVDYDYELESYQQFADVVNVGPVPSGWIHGTNQIAGNRVLVNLTQFENRYLSVNEISGGPSANTIIAGHSDLVFPLVTLIDGGGGNDWLSGDGGLLYGNAGDDELSGAGAILIGGDGNDRLTGLGGTRFVFTATETGIDKVQEVDSATERYFDWYYAGFGIADWQESFERGSKYRASFGEGDYSYFDTFAEAQSIGGSEITFISPLPGAAPLIRRTDTAALEALEAAGVLTRDIVMFGPGIGLSDLELTVRVIGLTADQHPDEPWYGGGTLNVRWGSGAGFDMAVPESAYGAVGEDLLAFVLSPSGNFFYPAWQDYDLGTGVELFEFADGGVYTLDQILQQATVVKRYGYEFLRGTGFQIVQGNWTGVDFGADIALSDLYAFQSGPDLIFGVVGDSATGSIPNWYANSSSVPQWEFRFTDGTVLDTDSVTRLGRTRIGSPGNDFMQTFSDFPSALIGLGGDDVLIGGAGNDLLNGGPGNDFLHGEAGNDIYIFGADSELDYVNEQVPGGGSNGIDTVRFNADVSTADLAAERNFDFLTLRVTSTGAELQLPGWFTETGGTVEILEFADGAVWLAADVEALLDPQVATDGDDVLLGLTGDDVLEGGEGDDVIYGFGGDDTLIGGPGFDFLLGGAGDDTYVFNPGDGIDEISDRAGSNTLGFGAGIDPQSVRVSRDHDSLYLSIAGSNDRVGIQSWYFAAQPQLSRVTFGDGTVWSAADLQSRVGLAPASEFDDILWGTDGADVIYGLAGDDQIYGNAGNDILDGGEGADYIESGAGHDILRGGPGDDDLEGWPGVGHKLLDGGEGDDYIYMEGRGVAIGGPGDDWIDIYGGNGIVAFNPGDGVDTIGANDAFILSVGGGVGPADLSLSEDGGDILISVGDADSVRLTNDFGGGPGSWPTIVLQLFGSAHVYFLGGAINEFYNARAADPSLTEFHLGDVLPRYLLVSSETGALGGVIAHQYATRGTLAHVSDAQLLTVLQDPRFGPFFQDTAFEGGNSAPVLANPLADLAVDEDAAFTYVLPADAFSDPDGDVLAYAVTLDDGAALPAWLSFDAGTRTIAGTPLQADVGTISVRVTATDSGGLIAADTFALTVANVNDAPMIAISLADQSFEAGSAFSFSIPEGAFIDEDPGDVLSLSASIFGGTPLPAWLSFDPATSTFNGNPSASHIGISHLQVRATDKVGASAAFDFGLVVRAAAGSEVVGTPDDDVLYGGTGDETITAKGGNDYLYGDVGDDLLKGGSGNDVLQGGDGADVLGGGKGQNVLDGGAGDDLIFGGKGSSLIVGGRGNDTIRTGTGSDVILFNRGDGMDTVIADRAGDNTLSFGGGIRYSDISLSRDGKNLIVSASEGDQITFKNWYGGKHSVLNLQIVLDATDEFDAGSSDPLFNKKVQTFDFLGMVSAFDAARTPTPGLTSWDITNALLQFHLFGADDMALGGDLAYWYGKKSNFTGISLSAAQQAIGAEGFGSDAQSLRPFDGLQEGFVKLA